MDYIEFVVEYTRQHPEMSAADVADASRIAWERRQQQGGDTISLEHQSRVMALEIDRAAARLMGSKTSPRKAATSAANGCKGGPPRQVSYLDQSLVWCPGQRHDVAAGARLVRQSHPRQRPAHLAQSRQGRL